VGHHTVVTATAGYGYCFYCGWDRRCPTCGADAWTACHVTVDGVRVPLITGYSHAARYESHLVEVDQMEQAKRIFTSLGLFLPALRRLVEQGSRYSSIHEVVADEPGLAKWAEQPA
jgi:hypothetical protein